MVDLKEVKRKNGESIVFCKFEDLLKEAYGVQTMEEVKTNLTGNDEYIIHCPFCRSEGHKKHKLYIKGDLTVGHCFVCGRAYVNVTDEVDLSVKAPDFMCNLFGQQKFEPVFLSDPMWSLDRYNYEFDDYSEKGVNYLIGRHGFMKDLYKILGFRFLDDNVVMPFHYHGKVFYYQIRFTGNSKIRYYFPPISAKPPYIIEKEHGNDKKFIIQEGVYDAIANMIMAPEYTPFSVLGSSISDYQLEFLKEYAPTDIIVYMDETKISIRIAEKLKASGIFCPIHIVKSNGEDPEEHMQNILKNGGKLQWITYEKFNKNEIKFNYGNCLGR